MEQSYLFEPIPNDKFDILTRNELVSLCKGEQDLNHQLQAYIEKLLAEKLKYEQKSFLLGEQNINIKHRLFGKSSEKSGKKKTNADKKKKEKQTTKKRVLLPSDRYPNISVIEKEVTLDELPNCPCCNDVMSDSGLTEDSEYLTVIPKQYYVVKQKRHKYRCGGCHGALVTTPAIPKIKVGPSYSDELILDAALSKYCDLIPIDRYSKMAERSGVPGIPTNSLIECTHNLAKFLSGVYDKIKEEVKESKVLHADETPHKMLEGDKKSNWYLWGFSTDSASYFEARDTRSGGIATNFLKDSKCEYLVSDVYSGYKRAITDTNNYRKAEDLKLGIENKAILIKNIYCNAHARRKFKESEAAYDAESKFMLWCYRKIYKLEKTFKDKIKNNITRDDKEFNRFRVWQDLYFRVMKRMGEELKSCYSNKSSLVKGINYFLKNYSELTMFLKFDDIPIDNNSQERQMRSPVIGRKTWYGTHSKRGAHTNALLFSLVESCKLNKINPRLYFKDIVHAIHESREIFTPSEYLKLNLEKSAIIS
jgi:transposase